MLSRYFIESSECPVCGRIHNYSAWEDYWCPYCGTSLSTLALRKLDNLSNRITALEENEFEPIAEEDIIELFRKATES